MLLLVYLLTNVFPIPVGILCRSRYAHCFLTVIRRLSGYLNQKSSYLGLQKGPSAEHNAVSRKTKQFEFWLIREYLEGFWVQSGAPTQVSGEDHHSFSDLSVGIDGRQHKIPSRIS